MSDQVAVITGANTGIGLETARELARSGMTVVLTARDREKGERAVAEIKDSAQHDRVELVLLDLASLASVRAATEELNARHDRIDLLINNAGLVLSDARTTEDGFEATFGVNHLGHFLWTMLLLDVVKASAPARIINLSSHAHRSSKGIDFSDPMREKRAYSGFAAYCDSKLANILFTRELARRLEGSGVVVHAVHPGTVSSGFAADGDTSGLFKWAVKIARPFMLSAREGARTTLHVATSKEVGETTGLYWARSKKARPTRYAQDDRAAERLFALSEKLVGTGATGPSLITDPSARKTEEAR